jgi:PAS domain S-box-containing protein
VAWIKGGPDYRYAYINPTYQTRFALPGTEYVGKTDFDLFPEPVAAELRANDAAVRETGTARQVTETVPTPDGVPRQWLVTKFALPDLGGESAVGGIALDVTAERLAEEKFRLAVEASPAGMVMVDEGGRIVLANANAERLFGYAAGELVGRPVDGLVPDRVRDRHPGFRAGFFQKPGSMPLVGRDGPLTARRRDGTEFPVEIGLSPIRTADGLLALATVTDVTARARAEQARARYAADLARSNRELEQFAYVASHDLQEPLRMVTSYLELVRERYEPVLDAKGRSWIGYAVDGAARMKELIEALLRYSRAGRRTRPFEPTDLAQVVADALLNLQAAVREAGAAVRVGPLPVVRGDRVQLTQLVQNLVGNALKFRGPRPAEVDIEAERAGAGWRIAVRDNGIGIDPKFRDRLFVLFQRLHPRTRYPGTGIGLAMCKRIVEGHGGRIWTESRPDEGAAFYWTMPDSPEGCHEPDTDSAADPVAAGG